MTKLSSVVASHWRGALDLVATIGMVFTAVLLGTLMLGPQRPAGMARPAVPPIKLPTNIEAPPRTSIGDAEHARVVLVEYFDFQCPYCGKFAKEVLPSIVDSYVSNGQVAVTFKNLPLPIHQWAIRAAVAAECGAQQGRYWAMHSALFALSGLDEGGLLDAASKAGLQATTFRVCATNSEVAAGINSDAQEARERGITSTPTFIVARRQLDGHLSPVRTIVGTRAVADFEAAIGEALAGRTSGQSQE